MFILVAIEHSPRPSWSELHSRIRQLVSQTVPENTTENLQPLTIILAIQHSSAPSAYAVLTTHGQNRLSIDDLFRLLVRDFQARVAIEGLLQEYVMGEEFHVLRGGEARSTNDLDRWKDGCEMLSDIASLVNRVFYNGEQQSPIVRPASATATRASVAGIWGFPESNCLYILYFLPSVSLSVDLQYE